MSTSDLTTKIVLIYPFDNRESGSLWWETVDLTTELQLLLKYHLPNKNPAARLSANIRLVDTDTEYLWSRAKDSQVSVTYLADRKQPCWQH